MLKARVITASILIAVVFIVLLLPQRFFVPVIFLLVVLGAWEYGRLVAMNTLLKTAAFTVVVALSFLASLRAPLPVLLLGSLWWLCAATMLFVFPRGQITWHRAVILRALMGWLILVPCGVSIVLLHKNTPGAAWVLFLLLMVWAADTGAYFAGKRFGKHLLASAISPKKTWEGAAGGFVAMAIIVGLVCYYWPQPVFKTPNFYIAVIAVFMFSIIGDLTESMIKRWMNVKDSGKLLPGHGGLLDRIDSLTAAAPIFTLIMAMHT